MDVQMSPLRGADTSSGKGQGGLADPFLKDVFVFSRLFSLLG